MQLQNHMGLQVWSSWRGGTKKISKLPTFRGLQKNHAQLPKHYARMAVSVKKLYFKRVQKRFMRKSSEHLKEQTKQIVKAKSSCQSKQRNVNQTKASNRLCKQTSQANNFAELI